MSPWHPREGDLERAMTQTEVLRADQRPQWCEVRQRLIDEGLAPEDAVLAWWNTEGQNLMGGIMGTRDGRVFDFLVTYGYDRDGRQIAEDVGWLNSWKEITPERIELTSSGLPNSWLQAATISQIVLESESNSRP